MQRNWIGRSEGAMVDFELGGSVGPADRRSRVFTTRIDTIYGATSVQLAPEHPLVADLIAKNPDLRAKVDELIAEQRKAKEVGDIGAIEKHGVFTGRYAINPFTASRCRSGSANYVLMDYGTGAIMTRARARRARLRVRQEVRPRRSAS